MSADQLSKPTVRVRARNVGGIDDAEVTLQPGVSVLTGRNATNRTSFLQAVMAGLGSDRASLKGSADEGSVTLEIGEETYTRTLQRTGSTVSFGGDPYLDDPELADLFAFLLENNEARRAVARGDDLREVIMRPIDTDRIDAEIESCKRERESLEAEIERLDDIERDLPELEAKRTEKRSELEEAREDLATIEAEIEELDAGVEESRDRKEELEAAFQRVRDARSELEDVEFDLETERTTLRELREEREKLSETLSEASEPENDPDWLAGRIEELRQRKRSLDERTSELGSVIGFNEEMLEGEGIAIDSAGADDPTDALAAERETTCWTCGSDVDESRIEETVDRLRDLRADLLDERKEVRSSIDELTDEQAAVRQRRSERERAERRRSEVDAEIETTESRIDDLESAATEQEERIAELEAEAETIDVEGHDAVLDLHRRANGIELRVEKLESELEEIGEEIAEREAAVEDRTELEAQREELADRLTELRTRVDRIEEGAVEAFNEHMATVLDILGYDNLDRIWIERRTVEVREGRRKVSRTRFDLHIIRTDEDGSAYEDTVDHLSESEREVTGLVFALAGYLVHDVHEVVPFVVLDSLEAIDADRIARVVDYFRDHADYLVAALLPEDAAGLSEEYSYIEDLG